MAEFLVCEGGTWSMNADGAPICNGNMAALTKEVLIADMDQTVLADLYELLNEAFKTPDVSDMTVLWFACFSLPVIAYLVSSSYGVVINWFK